MSEIEPLELDGVTYSREFIEEVRQRVIILRNEALRNLGSGGREMAVTLSHVIALLTHLRNNTERRARMASLQENEE